MTNGIDYFLCGNGRRVKAKIDINCVDLKRMCGVRSEESATYLIIWIVGAYGLSVFIESMKECSNSDSLVPVFGSSKHISGISLIAVIPMRQRAITGD